MIGFIIPRISCSYIHVRIFRVIPYETSEQVSRVISYETSEKLFRILESLEIFQKEPLEKYQKEALHDL